ncbi:MAG: glycosyltransferase WbuB, partial [Novosphingobium sp.]|nr:glycosyltransferase WbuB [Novosphingobium sp.]
MTRVLHVLDHSLPLQSGYTFRTRAILKAQQAMGIDVRAITGQRHAASAARTDSEPADPEVVDGLTFHRTPGTAQGLPLVREWAEVSALAERIVETAREWRPDV